MRFIHERLHHARWVPPWLRYQNATRYAWAAAQVKEQSVLEVGCGIGRGCRLFAESGARRVVGVDVDVEAIALAKTLPGSSGLEFLSPESDRLPFPDSVFDVVVALETIEHVKDDRHFLFEIRRVLHPDGVFLCSTPNRRVTNPGTTLTDPPFNPHHVREYTAAELEERLRREFGRVDLLGQNAWRPRTVALLNRLAAVSRSAARRSRQILSVASSPWDAESRHRPGRHAEDCEPEVLVAACRNPRGSEPTQSVAANGLNAEEERR